MNLENYSGTKCPKCESTSFEVVNDKPIDSNFDLMYIRCFSCKTLISVLEKQNINKNLSKLAKGLNIDLEKIRL